MQKAELSGRGPVQACVVRILARKLVGHEKTLPPSSFAKAIIVRGDDMRLSLSSLQHQFVAVYLANDPILVNLIGIEFAIRGRGDVLRPRSRRKAVFFSSVDNPIIRLKRTGHVDVPALSNACNLRRLAKPLLEEAFFNTIVLDRNIAGVSDRNIAGSLLLLDKAGRN